MDFDKKSEVMYLTYAYHYFIDVQVINRKIGIDSVHPNQAQIDGKNVIISIICQPCRKVVPIHLSYYTENTNSDHLNNKFVASCIFKENTSQSLDISCLTKPEFEFTKITMTDDFNSLPYTELESVSAYFNSIDIQNPYTFVICVKGIENTASS